MRHAIPAFDCRLLSQWKRHIGQSPILLACLVVSGFVNSVEGQARVLGLDVASWQGNISQNTWNNIHNAENRDFVFIRSSRGGTTGFYNQSDPNNNGNQNTLSQRYDDQYFAQNITRATNAGLYAGSYHFSRPDIVSSTQNSGGVANSGSDEADHFIQMAGAWMRPGYLLPVHDFEAGDGARSNNAMAQFALDFSNRMQDVIGIRPAIYVNGNYANFVIGGASSALRDQVVDAHPILWNARWPNQANPNSIAVQTAHPKDSYSPIYGPWDDSPNPTHPWSFWQYASTGRLNSFNNGNSNLDFNVAQGGIEFLKDNLVPALWMSDSDGEWTSMGNWNSGQAPVAPVQGPGQVVRVGSLSLPAARLPAVDDTVILHRTGADISVTLSSGAHSIRKLEVREALDITGGSLAINYVPSSDSTPLSAQFSAPVSVTGNASLSVHSLQVDASETFRLSSSLTFDTLQLMPHGTSPASLNLAGDISLSPLANATAEIVNGSGGGLSGFIDMGGELRIWEVNDGAGAIDVSIDVPMVNGAFSKTGMGTLELTGATGYQGDIVVDEGTLVLSAALILDTADVFLSSSAGLGLEFAGGPDVVNALFLNGMPLPAGNWGAPGSGAEFTLSSFSGSGTLQVLTYDPLLPGDYNDDGIVDAADFNRWRDNVGQPAGTLPNDNSGLPVGAEQYTVWKNNFGMSAAILAASVPEPSVPWLYLGVGCFVYVRRCRIFGR